MFLSNLILTYLEFDLKLKLNNLLVKGLKTDRPVKKNQQYDLIRISMYSQQNKSISKRLTKIPIVTNQVLSSITSLYKLNLKGQQDKISQVQILFGNQPEMRDLLIELHFRLVLNKAIRYGKMNEVFGSFAKELGENP